MFDGAIDDLPRWAFVRRRALERMRDKSVEGDGLRRVPLTAEELRAHVLLKCELGRYNPRKELFTPWVREVMMRDLITLPQSRGCAAGGHLPSLPDTLDRPSGNVKGTKGM